MHREDSRYTSLAEFSLYREPRNNSWCLSLTTAIVLTVLVISLCLTAILVIILVKESSVQHKSTFLHLNQLYTS